MAVATTWQQALADGFGELGREGLSAIVEAALADELRLLRDDPDLRELARGSAVANVELVVDMVRGTLPLDAYEPPARAIAFTRELARRNVPVIELTRAYRLAQRALWRWAVEQVNARIPDGDARADAVQRLSEASFATGDRFADAIMERYAAERERWLRSADAVRAATLSELLAGGPVDADAAGRRLRYELRQDHQPFVVWSDGEDSVPETAAAAIGGPGALLVPLGVGVIAGWAPAGALSPAAVGPGVGLALGRTGRGLRGFRDGHREALEARRVARLVPSLSSPVAYEDVALLAMLTRDVAEARAFALRTLGPLAAEDPATRRLAETLLVVLEEQGSPRRAAQRLGVHENTVGKRLRAIEALGGPPTFGGRRSAEVMAALLLHGALLPADGA